MSYSGAPRDLIKSVDERISENISSTKFSKENLKVKSKQSTPLTTSGYEGYVASKDPEQPNKIKISHASGPIERHSQEIKSSFLNPDAQYDPEIIANWVPQLSLTVFDENTMKPLSAAQVQTRMADRWVPHYFMNPVQDLDYITIESLTRFTFIGPLMDALNKFKVGTGFKPELELVNPSNDQDKDAAEIEANKEIIDTLSQIDNQVSVDSNNYMDTTFTDKISALMSVKDIFNRSALIFGYDAPVKVNGKTYKEIPSSLKFAHARDLGLIEADPITWRLKAAQWRNAFYMIPAKDMIYLWNPITSAKTRGSWLYGDSMIMPMIDASRTIRKNIGVNFPAMAEATWSGLFLMAIKPQGQNPNERAAEYTQVAQGMVRGGPNILMEDPNDVKFQNVDFNPKVNEFVAMTEMLIKYCIATTGMPHSMFYDEDSSNRATMIGKIQLAKDTVINPMRAIDGRMISEQWYQKWFRLIYKDSKPEIYRKFKITIKFSDLNISEWYDKIQAVNELDSRKQLTDSAYGDLAGIRNYKALAVPDAPVTPGGGNSQKFSIGNGEGFSLSKEKSLGAKRLDAVRHDTLEENQEATLADVIAWASIPNWDMLLHYVNPNGYDDRKDYEFIARNARNWDILSLEQKIVLIRTFYFRNSDFSVAKLLTQYGIKLPESKEESWWKVLLPTHKQHLIDPEKRLPWSKEFTMKSWNELSPNEKEIANRMYAWRSTAHDAENLSKIKIIPEDINLTH